MTCRGPAVAVCLLGLAVSQLAAAAESDDVHPYLEKGFSLDLGVFYPDRQMDLRVDGSLGAINTNIDFDESLRLKASGNSFSAQFSWKFSDNWSLNGQYFTSSDSQSAVLEEDIEWEDIVFNAGSFAAVGSDFSLTRFYFGRHLDVKKLHEFGIGLGIHWLHIGAFIEGEIRINGIPTGARRAVSEEVPLPNIGVWYNYSISPRWALLTRLDLLSADIGDYKGLMVNSAVGLNFQAFEHIGFGLNYNYFELDIDVDKSQWHGNVETVFQGVYGYVSFYY